MFVWRKRASAAWLAANETALGETGGQRLAIISKPASKNAISEIAGSNRRDLEKIRSRFGGTIEKLPRDWVERFSRAGKTKILRVGTRLVIARNGGFSPSRRLSGARGQTAGYSKSAAGKTPLLVIPTGTAFGTGEHTTTAMTLRLLEQTTRGWGAEWTLLDLGTGTGILALAAKRLGAARVVAIDHDPIAIATAKENARRNKIDNIDFQVADARRWKFPPRIDIIAANLFSELLIEILPKLKRAQWLILSGILREQEAQLIRALKRNGIAIAETRRRGKWIAILGQQIKERRLPSRRLIINGGLASGSGEPTAP
jgi:ribosomal protein L11 methyltransferase